MNTPCPISMILLTNLMGPNFFSALYLFKSYYKIPLYPEAKEKTTICTPAGNIQFRRLSVGLCNAVPSFQRYMDSLSLACLLSLFTEVYS